MTIDEGYIKYNSDWTPGPAPDAELCGELDAWRRPLHNADLIGHYEDLGIGFGNISVRIADSRQFVISGTQTGHIAETRAEHYALVTDYDIDANRVSCTGPVQASSEAMTHAAIYALSDSIRAIVHVHSRPLWDRYKNELPTTRPDVAYGTPEMAHEFERLYRDSPFGSGGIAVMAGHEEGIISFGADLGQAAKRILDLAET